MHARRAELFPLCEGRRRPGRVAAANFAQALHKDALKPDTISEACSVIVQIVFVLLNEAKLGALFARIARRSAI